MVRLAGISLCVCLAVYACVAGTRTEEPLKLYVLDCGMLRFESVEAFGIADDETDVRDLAVPCFVIEHERGRMLWDGGLPSELAETPGWQGEGGMRMRLDRTVGEQFADMELDTSSFDYVAFSHMHFDHIGVANELRGATLIIQKPEYEAAFADEVTVPGFDPTLYAGLRDLEHLVIEGEHDVFGDGRVRLIPAPGHTPGHQVLFVDLAATGPVVLSGDLYHFRFSRENKRVPNFNVDEQASRESMERIEGFLAEAGAELWIGHELAWFEQKKKAPLFYE
jgi:glyoxylase-like metal-dependent hydrolase (beta-lactamase superfamily II)